MNAKQEYSLDAALQLARANGVEDPEVACETHGVRLRYSELDEYGRMALEAGLDVHVDSRCLLLPTDRKTRI